MKTHLDDQRKGREREATRNRKRERHRILIIVLFKIDNTTTLYKVVTKFGYVLTKLEQLPFILFTRIA